MCPGRALEPYCAVKLRPGGLAGPDTLTSRPLKNNRENNEVAISGQEALRGVRQGQEDITADRAFGRGRARAPFNLKAVAFVAMVKCNTVTLNCTSARNILPLLLLQICRTACCPRPRMEHAENARAVLSSCSPCSSRSVPRSALSGRCSSSSHAQHSTRVHVLYSAISCHACASWFTSASNKQRSNELLDLLTGLVT